jgi:hypothetical protein
MRDQETNRAEVALGRDLRGLAPRAGEAWFARELYRALAGRRWCCTGTGDVATPTPGVAERIVNDLRARVGRDPMALAQAGAIGELSEEVDREMLVRGWRPMATATAAE